MNTVEGKVQDHEQRLVALEKSYGDLNTKVDNVTREVTQLNKSNVAIQQSVENEGKFTRELLREALGHKQKMEELKLESRTSIILKLIGVLTVGISAVGGIIAGVTTLVNYLN